MLKLVAAAAENGTILPLTEIFIDGLALNQLAPALTCRLFVTQPFFSLASGTTGEGDFTTYPRLKA